jgi:hypothetical protein
MENVEIPRLKLRQLKQDDYGPFALYYSDEANDTSEGRRIQSKRGVNWRCILSTGTQRFWLLGSGRENN